MRFDDFIGGSFQSQSPTADCEETINWYPEVLPVKGATSKFALYPTPGVTEIAAYTSNPGRAHFYQSGREFAVIGASFCEIDAIGTITALGAVAIDSNPATISSNGDGGGELFITSGTNGYIFDLGTSAFTQVAALNGLATQGDSLDGYFLCLNAATSTMYVSALLDGLTWTTGTDFAQRSLAPDPWGGMKVLDRYIWLFGETTSEVWYDTGATFPFAPHPAGVLNFGIASAWSPVHLGDSMVWLAKTKAGQYCVVRAAGFTPEIISTPPLEAALATYTNIAHAVGDSYSEAGHTFYLLSFDNDDVTWVWDTQTKLWSKRGTWDPTARQFLSWRPRYHAHAFGEHRMLDRSTGSVYRMSSSISTDVDDALIRRVRRAPCISDENKRVFFRSFELDLEPGLGNTVAPGDDPQVVLRVSNDAGKTWVCEMQRSAGKKGDFSRRVRWHRLGSAERRVFEVYVTDPIPWRLTGAFIDAEQESA